MNDFASSDCLLDAKPAPNLKAAQKAAWKARRLHVAGRSGKLSIGLGGYAVIFGLLFILNPKAVDSGLDLAGCWSMIIAVAIFSALLFWLHRHSLRLAVAKGEPVASFPPLERSFWYWFVPLCAIAAVLAGVLSFFYSKTEAEYLWALVMGGVTVLLLAVLFWYSFKYRLWEIALMAGSLAAATVVMVLFKEAACGWASFSYGVCFLIAGLSLHLRWRRWVNALPKNIGSSDKEAAVQ